MLVIIKGAGDLASGVGHRLQKAGYQIIMTDLAKPTAIRRSVAFSQALIDGETTIEGVTGRAAKDPKEAFEISKQGDIALLADPEGQCVKVLKPVALVDAILAKVNLGTSIDDAPLVVALGPGFTAGMDCHYVIETQRGHDLGRIYDQGQAQPNTGVPGPIEGYTTERILRAPTEGIFVPLAKIGDYVHAGQSVALVENQPVIAEISGVLRGLLPDQTKVHKGMKSGDVDPRCKKEHCFTVSDKARALGGSVLEVLLHARILP